MDETSKVTIKQRDLKKRGKKVLKSHYLFLLLTILVTAFVGSEFTDVQAISSFEWSTITSFLHIPTNIFDNTSEIFGQTRGVFAAIVSSISTGSIYDTIFSGINSLVNSTTVSLIIYILLSLIFAFAVWFFLGNIYTVVSRRIFLESRTYKKVSIQRFLYFFHVKKWVNISAVMFLKFLYNTLWYCVFIVGGIIKHYSYFLVPYIVAENPNISPRQAITLSRKMMYGHKFECFLLELSFLGWLLLRIVTFGLSGLFYSNTYQIATYSEYFVKLRTIAKQNNIEGSELLNDTYLYKKASISLINEKYAQEVKVLNGPKIEFKKPKNAFEFILDFLGISLKRNEEDNQKNFEAIKYNKAKLFEDSISQDIYPTRLFTLSEYTRNKKEETSNFMKKYSVLTLVLIFFIFAFIGWIWEVSLHLITTGQFINRGIMHGPWLPIYGSGGLLILTVLYKLRKKPVVQFFSAVVLCGIIEYFTAFFMELIHDGQKWWDYSGYFLNLHGRICAEGLLVFGLGGVAVVYLLAPMIDDQLAKVSKKILIPLAIALVSVFVVDNIYSSAHPNAGEGITSEPVVIFAPIENFTNYFN